MILSADVDVVGIVEIDTFGIAVEKGRIRYQLVPIDAVRSETEIVRGQPDLACCIVHFDVFSVIETIAYAGISSLGGAGDTDKRIVGAEPAVAIVGDG